MPTFPPSLPHSVSLLATYFHFLKETSIQLYYSFAERNILRFDKITNYNINTFRTWFLLLKPKDNGFITGFTTHFFQRRKSVLQNEFYIWCENTLCHKTSIYSTKCHFFLQEWYRSAYRCHLWPGSSPAVRRPAHRYTCSGIVTINHNNVIAFFIHPTQGELWD
jgi:hypothetical protein